MSEWDESADGWDDDEATNAYADGAFASLAELVAPLGLEGMSVLDFGCGTGLLTERLVSSGVGSVVAVDTSPAMIAVLDAKIASRSWLNVITSPQLPSGAFDLVVASSVLAFVDDYPSTVADLVTVLAPGGRFVQWDWERADAALHGLSRSEIAEALAAAGLDHITVEVGFEAAAYGQTMRPLMGSGRLGPWTSADR